MKKALLFFGVLLFGLTSFSQGELTLYNMRSLPQVVTQNPAFTPYSRFHFSLPTVSGVAVGFANNTVSFDRLLDVESILTTELEENADLFNGLYDDLDPDQNFAAADMQVDLLRFGFKIGWNYFGFAATEKISAFATFPKSIFELIDPSFSLTNGFAPISVSNASLSLTHYREYSFTYSRKVLEVLTVGASAKYLYGMENIDVQNVSLEVSSVNSGGLIPDLQMNGSAQVNSSLGLLPQLNGDTADFDLGRYGAGFANSGLGFDFGARLEVLDRFTISASVLDLGSINWKENPNNFDSEINVAFSQEELAKDSGSTDGFFLTLLDTTVGAVENGITKEAYNQALTPKLNLGFGVSLTDRIDLNVLSYTVLSEIPRSYIMLGTNIRIRNSVNLLLNYSASNVSVESVGFGLSFNLGALQLYAITDDLVSIATFGNNLNGRIGINFTFSNDFED